MSSKRRSERQASNPKRKRSVYLEPDTDDDEFEEYAHSSTAARYGRQTINSRTRQSQGESSDFVELPSTSTKTRKSSTRRVKRKLRSSTSATVGHQVVRKVSSLVGGQRRRARSKPIAQSNIKAPSKVQKEPVLRISQYEGPSDGVKPLWGTLPYEILLSIFSFAYDDEPRSHTWLLRTARKVCRAFAEPALSAFYQNPRLPTSAHLENLYALARMPIDRGYINYKVKVRTLDVNIHAFVNRKDDNDTFEFASLIAELPQLEAIFITSQQDKPPYRRHQPPRWKYSPSLFESIDKSSLQMKAWRWNWFFVRQSADSPRLLDYMVQIHQSPSFRTVTHLEICDHLSFVGSEEEQASQEGKIAEAIGLLPTLRSLEFETCDIVNARFLEGLPKSLSRLRLANCEALESDAMETFLSQDGGCQLEELVLDHNVRLDLAFLPILGPSCRRLKRLSMDLHYYSQHHTVNDADARYKHLLTADQVPTWPATLQSIELLHLQKWSADGAVNLFSSLLDAAEHLTQLRTLILHAHISISWRDRASFRDRWIDRLTKVFLRKCPDPDPNLASMKAFRDFRLSEDVRNGMSYKRPPLEGRRVSGVSIPVQPFSESDFSSHEDDKPSDSNRRSRRIAAGEIERQARSARHTSASASAVGSPASDDEDEEDGDGVAPFVQGLCNVVDIRIDNQRPREEQFNESHFLDSEESGDEDWSEGAEMPDEGYAW